MSRSWSATSLRRACQTISQNMAAISGTSFSSSTVWAPRQTSQPMAANVVTTTTPSTHRVGLMAQTRKPYSSVRLIQMKWNGTVSQCAKITIDARLIREKTNQAASTQATWEGQELSAGAAAGAVPGSCRAFLMKGRPDGSGRRNPAGSGRRRRLGAGPCGPAGGGAGRSPGAGGQG